MNQSILESYINQGLSSHKIASAMSTSQTNIRYWMKKFNLQTKLSATCNNLHCLCCNTPLTKKQIKFCSVKCKHKTKTYKEKNYVLQQRRRHNRKLKLVNLAGGKCQRCGYNKNFAALHFHHINPTEKGGRLDIRTIAAKNWEWCLTEFKKCQLLCSNCHSEHHNPDCNLTVATLS